MRVVLLSVFFAFLFSLSTLASEGKLEEDESDPSNSVKKELKTLDISKKSSNFVSKRQKDEKLQLRYQVEEDLRLLSYTDDSAIKNLSRSVCCIGTGRNNRALLMDSHQQLPTMVTENDFCLDKNKRLGPDICDDAWKVAKYKDKIKSGFSMVYFAHVGHGIPLKSNEALSCYFDLLEPGGAFLYKSYVVAKSRFKKPLFDHNLEDRDQMIKDYTDALNAIGFSRVQILIKQEKRFGNIHEDDPSISLIIFALK
jgi:hypothetical protein